MRRHFFAFTVGVLLLTICATMTIAGEDTKLTYKGVYTAWFQSQHDFTLGRSEYDDNYAVQMLRMKLTFAASEAVRAVTRFDMAQGWWGVDNADRTVNRTGKTGGSSLFDFKDTNFLLHVDQAYIEFDLPDDLPIPVQARVGRMWYGLGNKMILDNNYDGIQIAVDKKIQLGYAKVSEGADGISDLEIKDDDGNVIMDGDDAHLFTGQFKNKVDSFAYEAFAMHYIDASDDDGTTFMPNDINYFRSRFTPHVSQLTAGGLSGNYKNKDLGLNVIGEVNYLVGKDDVENSTINAIQLTDVNDGDLTGYNVYLKATKAVDSKIEIGAVAGMGSGDDDWTGGDGNVNKLRTSGFFYITEVWEDSIMPDEEGITPQGLGAPNIRAYRELENTTLVQLNGKYKHSDRLSLFGSFTLLRATEEIHAWHVEEDEEKAAETVIDDGASNEIGQEVDWRLDWKIYPYLVFTFRGGVFMPGDGAGYLINGTNKYDDMAWEHKTTITLRF